MGKGSIISETRFLCDIENEKDGNTEKIRFVLIL